jgi:phosphatidylinositol-3-phosphatase
LLEKTFLALVAIVVSAATTTGQAAPARKAPCGTRASATYTHVVVVVMENHELSRIVGSSEAPYENALADECGVATEYYGVAHPSLPNYIAMTAGTTAGITDDKAPHDHGLTNASIFLQAGSHWRSYQESMPSNCELSSSGLYAVKHNPAAYFTNVRAACAKRDVPLPSSPSFSAAYTFVTPNRCNDMHDCSVSTGDTWLRAFVPRILASPEYRHGHLVLFLTWDEGGGRSGTNHIPLIVVAPSVPVGLRVSTRYTHYGLLRTVEELLAKPCIARACSAASLRRAFHL